MWLKTTARNAYKIVNNFGKLNKINQINGETIWVNKYILIFIDLHLQQYSYVTVLLQIQESLKSNSSKPYLYCYIPV